MNKICLIVTALFVLLLPVSVSATTRAAASCSRADINTAIGLSSPGDTVTVTSSCTWAAGTTCVSVNVENLILDGQGTTTITESQSDCTFSIAANGVVIKGFALQNKPGDGTAEIVVADGVTGWWITGNSFKDQGYVTYPTRAINVGSQTAGTHQSSGLISKNTFTNSVTHPDFINVFGGGASDWAIDLSLGSATAVYVENNTFVNSYSGYGSAVDGDVGSRVVFRHNDLTNCRYDNHGLQQTIRGQISFEIIANKFTCTNPVGSSGCYVGLANLRGGTGVVYGNSVINAAGSYINIGTNMTEYRGDIDDGNGCAIKDYSCYGAVAIDGNTDYATGTVSNPCADCSTTVANVSSLGATNYAGYRAVNITQGGDCKIASNTSSKITCEAALTNSKTWTVGDSFAVRTGYPCQDQLGWSWVSSTRTQRPVALWNNQCSGSGLWESNGCTDGYLGSRSYNVNTGDPGCYAGVSHIQKDRDFCYSVDATPITTCNGISTAYTPYTCPHPLVGTGHCDSTIAGTGGYFLGNSSIGSGPGVKLSGPGITLN